MSAIPPNVPPAPSVPRVNPTDTMYWSIRRELWESKSITIAPLAVAGLVLFILAMTAFGVPHRLRSLPEAERSREFAVAVSPLRTAPSPIVVTTLIVAFFFSLDALYGERRDRTILFWKSLPVSDRTTVLSKAAFPLAILPLIGFVLSIVVQLILLAWTTIILVANGIDPQTLWVEVRLLQMPVILLYGIAAFTLWHAPIYGWFFLISGWARRAPILWGFVPLVTASMVERMAFHTNYIGAFEARRFMGAYTAAFDVVMPAKAVHYPMISRIEQINVGKFLSTPGLWLGLLFAAACFAAAIRLRRYREPI
jgi:ABC-2 type transport system permease protein